MSWFIFAIIATLSWGFADLFYKKSSDDNDRYSHLKITIWVGLVMGITSLLLLVFSKNEYTFTSLIKNGLAYSPASIGYIVSMVVGYAGLRYLEVSIISPIQNGSGAFSALAMIIFFSLKGQIGNFFEEYSILDISGTVLIVLGVILLGIIENRLARKENLEKNEDKKYRLGALALLFPILYCVFDTLGTAADGIILDGKSGLHLGEIDVLIIYGLTFFAIAIIFFAFLCIKQKNFYNPFSKNEVKNKGVAALFEQSGQIFYIYAMAAKPVLAAPMIASYCIISVILSRIFLKERLNRNQYLCVASVILGIIILGISEGISEI